MKSFYTRLAIGLIMVVLFLITMIIGFIAAANGYLINELVIPMVLFLGIFAVLVGTKGKAKGYKVNVTDDVIPEKFNYIYNDLYKNHIWALEQSRKKVRLRTVIANILLGIYILTYMMSKLDMTIISKEVDSGILIGGIIALPIYIVVILNNIKYKANYKRMYKNNVLKEFFNIINDKLIYKPEDIQNAYGLETEYRQANFDNKRFNRFMADDYIEGNLDERTFVKMGDLDIKNDTGSGKNRNVEHVFEGIFAITTCDKNIGTYVKITKDKKDFFGGQDRIQMDSEEFEKSFNVYAQDRILATRLLTSDIMQMLIDFYNKYQLMFEIVIKDSTIYLRFNTGAMFEPKIFGNSMDKELLYIYCCILEFVSDITQKINKVVQEIDM